MEKINGLLKELDNKVPPSIAKRLDGLKKLNQKLVSARAEHNENPTEQSQESLDEIVDFLNDTQEDIIEDLSTLVEQKRDADSKIQAQAQARSRAEAQARSKAQAEARSKAQAEAEAQAQEELEKKQLEEEALKSGGKTETKKSSIGWGSLLLGGALLVVTGGAIKYFGNKR